MFRNTKQKLLVYKAAHELCHPTAQEIYQFVKNTYPSISMGTVYRILGALVRDHTLLHIKVPDKADCYDWNNIQHYHLICKKCGKVCDMNIPYMSHLNQISSKEYLIEDHTLLFSGECPQCHQ